MLYDIYVKPPEREEGLDANLDDIEALHEDHVEALQLERFEFPTLLSSIIDMRALPAHIHQLKPGRRYRPAGEHALLRALLSSIFIIIPALVNGQETCPTKPGGF